MVVLSHPFTEDLEYLFKFSVLCC